MEWNSVHEELPQVGRHVIALGWDNQGAFAESARYAPLASSVMERERPDWFGPMHGWVTRSGQHMRWVTHWAEIEVPSTGEERFAHAVAAFYSNDLDQAYFPGGGGSRQAELLKRIRCDLPSGWGLRETKVLMQNVLHLESSTDGEGKAVRMVTLTARHDSPPACSECAAMATWMRGALESTVWEGNPSDFEFYCDLHGRQGVGRSYRIALGGSKAEVDACLWGTG